MGRSFPIQVKISSLLALTVLFSSVLYIATFRSLNPIPILSPTVNVSHEYNVTPDYISFFRLYIRTLAKQAFFRTQNSLASAIVVLIPTSHYHVSFRVFTNSVLFNKLYFLFRFLVRIHFLTVISFFLFSTKKTGNLYPINFIMSNWLIFSLFYYSWNIRMFLKYMSFRKTKFELFFKSLMWHIFCRDIS